MNRSINILLLVVSFPAMALSIFVGFDLPIEFLHTTASQLPYKAEIFYVIAGLLLLLIARRSVQRWVGVGMTRKPERFIWCAPIGAERQKQVRMYLILEAAVALAFVFGCWQLTIESWPLMVVYGLMCLDQLLFLAIASKWFRIGITQKALVVADRELRVLYFQGLRRVELHQQTIYFEYIEDLQLHFPTNCVPEGKFAEFRDTLESRVNRDKVFFSEKFKKNV